MAEEPSGQLLIVDDDPELLQFLLEELSQDSIVCQGANCGAEALLLLRQQHFDLVVLDWNLPDFNGLEICRRLRSSGDTTPVLMLTAHHDLEDRVQALDLGADDYITKPFELPELHARVRAQLRRSRYTNPGSSAETLTLGDLQLDLINRKVQLGERELALSQREFDLLAFLVKHHGEVQARQHILDSVWGAPFVGDPNTLDVYMGYLRRKLEGPDHPRLLHTVRGVGFMARLPQA